MGAHLIDGEFQSDKYPTTPRGKVPLSCKDPTAQDLLWNYAKRRRAVDAEFSDDLEEALSLAGYDAKKAVTIEFMDASAKAAICALRGLEQTAIMLETYAPEVFPEVNEQGQKHFGRVMMESAARAIREAWAAIKDAAKNG
jgi:hypothetical protein